MYALGITHLSSAAKKLNRQGLIPDVLLANHRQRAREKLIRPLAEIGTTSVSDVDAVAGAFGLSPSFTYKLLASYKARPNTSSLLLGKRGSRTDSRMLDLEREQVIETAIQECYLRRERPRLSDIMREIAHREIVYSSRRQSEPWPEALHEPFWAAVHRQKVSDLDAFRSLVIKGFWRSQFSSLRAVKLLVRSGFSSLRAA